MLRILRVGMVVFGIMLLGSSYVQAATPQETLNQYVTDLKKNPSDYALREKIIRHVQEMKPTPKIPDEVYEYVGKATYILTNAKTEADCIEAVKAYKTALLIAPWVADYYFNLGIAQEKAGLFEEAINNLRFYLSATLEAKDATAIRERIGMLKYAAEKKAREEKERSKELEKIAITKELVDRLNRAYAGKQFWKGSNCVPKYRWTEPGGWGHNAGCTWDEYNGSNWVKYENVDRPTTLTFSLSSEGKNNILLNLGFPEPSYIGTVNGRYIEDIEWVRYFAKEKGKIWLQFLMDGSAFVTSTSPVQPGSSGFDRYTPYNYTIYK